MALLPAEVVKLKNTRTKHEIRKAFALVIVNEKFQYLDCRYGADADRKNIYTFCKNAQFTLNDTKDLFFKDTKDLKTDDLTAEEMEDLFKTISKGDFSCYDAFICFISSHGDSGGILGVDCDIITVKEIVRHLKRCSTLAGKPKLFFVQGCRPYRKDDGYRGKVVADHGSSSSITIPIESDILVAYSSLDGYESYRNVKEGSWFITVLMQVLNKYAHYMNLTDMLAIVNEMVANGCMENCGRKQMAFFMSTLRKAVCLKISEPNESQEVTAMCEEV